MKEKQGVIYILTNPSFPEYVKIGYASNIERRLKELNRSECIPFAFRVYATYEVDSNLSDKKIHSIIDRLNPNLRSIDNFNGQMRVREFYAMTPEDAYSILEAIAEINGYSERLRKHTLTETEKQDEAIAEEIIEERKERAAPFNFSMCHIQIGEELEYWPNVNTRSDITCIVVDNKHVKYQGEIFSLSSLAKKLLNSKYNVPGPCYFKYKGRWLNDIRDEFERNS